MERSADWLDQARGDLQHARSDVERAFYDWACFSAQQAAEKAAKRAPVWFPTTSLYPYRSGKAGGACYQDRQVL
jgi:hypothetical protein